MKQEEFGMEPGEKKLIPIDSKMSAFLHEVARRHGLLIDEKILESVLSDSQEDMVNEKEYMIAHSRKWALRGKVDGYEPETIWMELIKK
jgi:hypothetical protein